MADCIMCGGSGFILDEGLCSECGGTGEGVLDYDAIVYEDDEADIPPDEPFAISFFQYHADGHKHFASTR